MANFIQDTLNNPQDNAKKFWQNIKEVLPNSMITLKYQNQNFIQNYKEMADTLNKYFPTIGPSLAVNLQDPWFYNGNLTNFTLDEKFNIENEELLTILQDIDITKSSAIEFLSSKILKDALICLIEEFKFLLNLSFSSGIFYDACKKGQIIPLPKDGDLTLCNNYRPISLLPLPGKITEKIVHTRLINYFEEHEPLNKNQGGFRKNNSTINSVSEFTHEIFTAINKRDISEKNLSFVVQDI